MLIKIIYWLKKSVFGVKEKALTHKDVENVNTNFLDKCRRTVLIILEGMGKSLNFGKVSFTWVKLYKLVILISWELILTSHLELNPLVPENNLVVSAV